MPTPANPAARVGHRVYLRRMLLSESVTKLLPDWAFFVRCVVDTTELRPTASREELYDDDLLADTRDALGAQVRDWLVRLAATDPERLQDFLSVHHLGVKALAVHDLAMLRIVDQWIQVETNQGPLTLQELRRRSPLIRYTATADEFRELAAVSGAQGISVVNGGYVYEIDIIRQLPRLDPAVQVRRLDPSELATHFEKPDPATEVRIMPMRQAAEAALDRLGCAVIVRAFDPPSLAALYLVSRQAIRANEMRNARDGANELWQEVLAAVDDVSAASIEQPKLVLNLRSPVVARIVDLPEPKLVSIAVEALYGQALLQGRHPLTAQDGALMNRSFIGLLDWAMGTGGQGSGGAPGDWAK
jgi:molecular chaperone HtpG